MAAFCIHNFNFGKQLVSIISHLSTNRYALKNSYESLHSVREIHYNKLSKPTYLHVSASRLHTYMM